MRIALAGFGKEGRASYEYWNRDGNELTVADERDEILGLPDTVTSITGPDAFSKLGDFDLIIRSPGVDPSKLPYGERVWSATNEFFDRCNAPIIGVTGTKGKGTTSSLIASILIASGKSVHLVGNIGTPALAELEHIKDEDIVVYELSSFQLWDIKKSPHVAVVLMIEPDHLDVHKSFEEYINAKANIVRYQATDDVVVFDQENEYSTAIANQSAGTSRVIEPDELASSTPLRGEHNIRNAAAAIAATADFASDRSAIKTGISSFLGLPHRLRLVAQKDGVSYYDDSIATTPGSAIAAIKSFDEPKLLILGGHGKGADYTELIQTCRNLQVAVLAIGANKQEIMELCAKVGVECGIEPGDMNAIVKRASIEAKKGSVVILSPAAASFDMFESYADRGDQFIAAVNGL